MTSSSSSVQWQRRPQGAHASPSTFTKTDEFLQSPVPDEASNAWHRGSGWNYSHSGFHGTGVAMFSARRHSMRYLMLTENSIAVLNGFKQMQQQFTHERCWDIN
jgi:hypothetical protein